MNGNFLPLRREIRDHWTYQDSQYFHLWIDMLFNARFSHQPKKEVYKGVMYTLNRGEFLFSRPSYANRLNVTENRVRKAVELLIKDNMIEVVSSLGKNKPTIYKIINYETYNNSPSESVGTKGFQELSTKSPPSEHQVTTKSPPLKKKEKIDKNEKELIPFVEIVNYLNGVSNKSYKHSTKKTQVLIKARYNEGFRLDDFKKVIDIKTSQWLNDNNMNSYIRPETLFGTKFEGYLNEKPKGEGGFDLSEPSVYDNAF